MNMVYKDNTLFIDLKGEVDIDRVKYRLFNIATQYNFKDVVIFVGEVFDYKKRAFDALINDYSKVYNGHIRISKG